MMKNIFGLAFQSWRARRVSVFLSIGVIALSVGLLMSIEQLRRSVRNSFAQTISGTDLIVGARGGSTELLLYSVFHIGSAAANVKYSTFKRFQENPRVNWLIPISLGDSHKGFRVVGTSEAFFKHFKYRKDKQLEFFKGKPFKGTFDVVLGSEVARRLSYKVGDKLVLSHGVSSGEAIFDHGDKPFTVTGVLENTGTPADKSLYVTLAGMEAIHIDWAQGVPPLEGEEVSAQEVLQMDLEIKNISAFYVGLRSKFDILRIQREINTFTSEPLSAILPTLELNRLWGTVSYAEGALRIISILVIAVSLVSMLIAVYSSLQQRRREIAILRAVGASSGVIFSLFFLDSILMTVTGSILGFLLSYAGLAAAVPVLDQAAGILIELGAPTATELLFLAAVLFMGVLVGLLPAWRAYKNTLLDGLTIKF
jgi:putative ABC transport system permease protein